MKKFTFEDYKYALEGSGPDSMESLFARAVDDLTIYVEEYSVLVDLLEIAEGIA